VPPPINIAIITEVIFSNLDIRLAVHYIITNLVHKFLVHSHKLHKIKYPYMFRAQSAHHQDVNDANCTYAASGIVALCKWPSCATAKEGLAQDGHLQRVTIPEAAHVQFASLTSWWWADCARNTRNLILCNLCEWTRNLCIKLVIKKVIFSSSVFVIMGMNGVWILLKASWKNRDLPQEPL
jgi:hypothetical protein